MIEDTAPANTNDNITIKSDTTNTQFVISDPVNTIDTSIAGATGGGTNTVLVPFGSVTGSAIFVNTLAGDDFLTVDLSLGNFAKTITYDGGTNGAGGDELRLQGGGIFANVTHTFTSASAGSVAVMRQCAHQLQRPGAGHRQSVRHRSRLHVYRRHRDASPCLTSSAPPDMAIDSTLGEIVLFQQPHQLAHHRRGHAATTRSTSTASTPPSPLPSSSMAAWAMTRST